MANILVFGASITYGAWDEEGGWVARLRKFIDQKILSIGPHNKEFNYLVYNLGISGERTTDLIKRFEKETEPRIDWEDKKTIFLFQIGVNDTQFVESQQRTRTSREDFAKNIEKIIELARKYSSGIIFLGLAPVDDKKLDPIPWHYDNKNSYKNIYVEDFNIVLKDVCNKKGVYFIDLFEKLNAMGKDKILEDGLHPNSKGHEIIFEEVKGFLLKNKII